MTRAAGGKLRRFQSAEIESDRVVILPADHPAVVEGRTLYPSRVKREHESQRYLVSGLFELIARLLVPRGLRL